MAITGYLGETLRTSIHHIAADNTPILGATFTVVTAIRPDGSVFPVTFNELGSGLYEAVVVTATTDQSGEWFLMVDADNGYRYEETFDISRTPHTVTIEVPLTPQSGPSRAEMRRAVASSLGDLVPVVATDNGQEATVIDHVNLLQEVNAFNGMQIICTDAYWPENIGHVATITSNLPSARSVNFEPPLPMPSLKGDTFEMYNFRGNGWRVEQYNSAINQAIVRAGDEHAPLPYVVTMNHDAEYLSIPMEFSHFSGVQAIGRDGKRTMVSTKDYTVERGVRELSLSGRYSYRGGQYRTLRLIGFRRPDRLGSDTDRTHVPFDWVVHEASAILLQHDVSMGITQGERDRLLAMSRQGADGRRSMVIRSFPPNTIKLDQGGEISAVYGESTYAQE